MANNGLRPKYEPSEGCLDKSTSRIASLGEMHRYLRAEARRGASLAHVVVRRARRLGHVDGDANANSVNCGQGFRKGDPSVSFVNQGENFPMSEETHRN